METLKNHTLVYDSECPMCDLYTNAFVKTGMLDTNGRVQYGCARVPVSFDNQRAKDEIALIDYENGTVLYGIDSLIKVVTNASPWLKPILSAAVVRYPLSLLYSFISYNRKVIAPPSEFEKRGSCTPTYHTGYRIAYLVFAWFITSLVLTSYSEMAYPIVPKTNLYREFLVCGGQILFQMVFVRFMKPARMLHYLGNMMTVSLIGALLLLPVLIASGLGVVVSSWFAIAWFGAVVTYMLFIHKVRVKKLGIHWSMTTTWVLYRLIVLFIILP
jgi:predicted DCC family thiol-disulfide oxidoreductase YuxK